MPRKVEWFLRLPDALQALEQMQAPVLDRKSIQQLFDVSPRQAVRIMHLGSAFVAGKSLVVDRGEFIRKLQHIRDGDGGREERRWQRVASHLAEVRKTLKVRKVEIAATPETRQYVLADLPPGVRLEPSRLEIVFQGGARELLQRLAELAFAISNDFERFEGVVGES